MVKKKKINKKTNNFTNVKIKIKFKNNHQNKFFKEKKKQIRRQEEKIKNFNNSIILKNKTKEQKNEILLNNWLKNKLMFKKYNIKNFYKFFYFDNSNLLNKEYLKVFFENFKLKKNGIKLKRIYFWKMNYPEIDYFPENYDHKGTTITTITIIKSENENIFGGVFCLDFTTGHLLKPKNNNFLFILKKDKKNFFQKFNQLNDEYLKKRILIHHLYKAFNFGYNQLEHKSFKSNVDNTIINFGDGDLTCYYKNDEGYSGSSEFFGLNYELPKGVLYYSKNARSFFGENKNGDFKIKEIEIFLIEKSEKQLKQEELIKRMYKTQFKEKKILKEKSKKNKKFIIKYQIESNLLNEEYYKILFENFNLKIFGNVLKRIYCGTIDGMDADSFHKRCDNKGPTLTIIETKDENIFGGFTSLDWDTYSYYKSKGINFLFILKKDKKYYFQKFNQKKDSINFSIYCIPNKAICFGNCDLFCFDKTKKDCHEGSSEFFGNCYELPKEIKYLSKESKSFFGNNENGKFEIKEIETFLIEVDLLKTWGKVDFLKNREK